jgi:tetratricopeptide (TPR) repeat protein
LSSTEELPSISAQRHTEPAKLTRLVRGELDWIVMKALEKDRSRRYETANGFAMDVQRYLADEPVLACPPSAGYRLRKYVRRHKRALATVAIVGLIVLVSVGAIAGSIGWIARDQAARSAAVGNQVQDAVEEAHGFLLGGQLHEAKTVAKRARDVLATGPVNSGTQAQVNQLDKDVKMVERLEEIRLEQATVVETTFDTTAADPKYADTFRDYGIDVEALARDEAVRRISASAIRVELAVALDDWAYVRKGIAKPFEVGWRDLLAIAQQVDPDTLRNAIRSALANNDRKSLPQLAEAAKQQDLPPASTVRLARALHGSGQLRPAVDLLRVAFRKHPRDFWINHELAMILERMPRHQDEKIRHYTVAVTLRPDSPGAHLNLGVALERKGAWDMGVAEYRIAIKLAPHFVLAHTNLGFALRGKGRVEEAMGNFKKALRLKPDYAPAHQGLGESLEEKGQLAEAEVEFREALRLQPKNAWFHNSLGYLLWKQGKPTKAEEEYREANRLQPGFAGAHLNLGVVLSQQGQKDAAEKEYREAIRLQPDYTGAHRNLGVLLINRGQFYEADLSLREAVRLEPNDAGTRARLGNALRLQGRLAAAENQYREALRLQPDNVNARSNLGYLYSQQGKLGEAVAEFQEVVRRRPDDAYAHNSLGSTLRDQGQLAGAAVEFRKAIQLKPALADAHKNLGWVLRKQGNLIEAEKACREAVRLDPSYPWAHDQLGRVLYTQGKWEAAIAAYEHALRLLPDAGWSCSDLASIMANCPDLKLRNPSRALELAKKGTGLAPAGPGGLHQAAWAWQILGWAHYRSGNWKESIEALKKSAAFQQNPKGGDAGQWSVMAMAYWRLGNKEEARKWFEQASLSIDQHATSTEILGFQAEAAELLGIPGRYRGRAYAQRGAWDKAGAEFALAFAQAPPRNAEVWFEYACLLAQIGDTAGYRKLCHQVLERFGNSTNFEDIVYLAHTALLMPDGLDEKLVLELAERRLAMTPRPSGHHAWSVHLVGLAHYRAGHYQRAIEWFDKGLKEDPNWEERVYHWLLLAMAHHRLGHAREARKWMDLAEKWFAGVEESRKKGSSVPLGGLWRGWLLVKMVHREAKETLKKMRQ